MIVLNEPNTEMLYKTTDDHSSECSRGIAWDDPALGIAWPVPKRGEVPAIVCLVGGSYQTDRRSKLRNLHLPICVYRTAARAFWSDLRSRGHPPANAQPADAGVVRGVGKQFPLSSECVRIFQKTQSLVVRRRPRAQTH